MGQTLGWLILIILPCISATDIRTHDVNLQGQTSTISSASSIQQQSTNNNENLEHRLIRLEVLLVEKLENLRVEARDSSRRLQALEWQSAEVHSTLKDLRADMTKIVQQGPSGPATPGQQSNTMLTQAVEDLDKDVKMLMTATTFLTSDVNNYQKNVTSLVTDTRESCRRLQAPAVVNSTIENLRADLIRIAATPVHQSNTILEQAVEVLHKDVKTLQTFLTSDVNDLKKNVSSLMDDTRSMIRATSHFVTKQFLNQSILDLRNQPPSFPIFSKSSTSLPKNCQEVKETGQTHNGIYSIQPEPNCKPVSVFCDLQTRGGGWTVIHNRFDGSEDFYRNWHDYKYGFGNLSGEFWLGLDTIHKLTGCQANELSIELQFSDLQNKTAEYAKFSVGPEREGFPLKIVGYSGDARDSMTNHHGQKFTTKDVDQDSNASNCAVLYVGAWWYKNCHDSNHNGKYFGIGEQVPRESITKGMCWYQSNAYKLLIRARMLVRPRAESSASSMQPQSTNNNENLEHRLIRLEVLLVEKLENLRVEARDSSRRLQALEWQSAEVHSTLKDLRADMNKIVQQGPSGPATPGQHSNTMLTLAVEDLDKDVKMLMTATTFLTSDVNNYQKNVTSLVTDTRESCRRLQALEWQPAVVNSTIENLRADLTRIAATPVQQSNTVLEQAVELLHKDVKTLQTFLTFGVNDLKKNVSSLMDDTRSMIRATSHFVTTQFLNQSILNLKNQPPNFPIFSKSSTSLPKNCQEVKETGQTQNGIYSIQPEPNCKPVSVFCDLQTRGGGWTVIHNRFDGSEDFYRNWHDYKYGFGNLSGEFWLGLDTIHKLTGCQANELLIELQFIDLQNKTADYAKFSVGPERMGFPLKIVGYSGDAGDSMTHHHNQKFSTKDVDQDSNASSCAVAYVGAWWYGNCHASNLNGKYFGVGEEVPTESITKGMCWYRSDGYKLLIRARMLVRPRAEAVCDSF